ncbi:MAG: flagellar filament capping protein FliD [Gammaproteobacteria bacterium]
MLSTPGIGSGLDINGIIDQLMTLERRPLVKLGTQQVELEAQLSGFGKLKSTISLFSGAMRDLADPDKFKQFKATTSAEAVLTANADSSAARGNYDIEVVRTAENHRLAANLTVAPADLATKIGAEGDEMTITVGTTAFTVEFGDKTLAEIRDTINAASANSGVTASILQDDTGYRLTLSADDTGSDNFVSVAYAIGVTDPFDLASLNSDRDGSTSFDAADLDAVMLLENTFTVTRSSNTVSDVIEGVTLNLAGTGNANVAVARDVDKIRGSVNQFIGLYNEVIKTVSELRGGVLEEERSSLNSLERQFRAVLNTPSGGEAFDFLFELGVETQRDGSLSLNAQTFDSALAFDPEGVAAMFADADNGLAKRFVSFADRLTSAGGLLDGRETSLNSRIRTVEDKRGNIEFRLQQREAALIDQFSALDALVAQLNTTSSFLTSQLDQLAAATKSSNGG